jgi:hypothetical protein
VSSGALAAGDVSFHHGLTLHMAHRNATPRMREALAVCYFADGASIAVAGGSPFQAALLRHYFPTLRPGDRAAGPDNPIIASRDHQEGRSA